MRFSHFRDLDSDLCTKFYEENKYSNIPGTGEITSMLQNVRTDSMCPESGCSEEKNMWDEEQQKPGDTQCHSNNYEI